VHLISGARTVRPDPVFLNHLDFLFDLSSLLYPRRPAPDGWLTRHPPGGSYLARVHSENLTAARTYARTLLSFRCVNCLFDLFIQ